MAPRGRSTRSTAHRHRAPRGEHGALANPSPQILDDVMRLERVGGFALPPTPPGPALVTTVTLGPAALTLALSEA